MEIWTKDFTYSKRRNSHIIKKVLASGSLTAWHWLWPSLTLTSQLINTAVNLFHLPFPIRLINRENVSHRGWERVFSPTPQIYSVLSNTNSPILQFYSVLTLSPGVRLRAQYKPAPTSDTSCKWSVQLLTFMSSWLQVQGFPRAPTGVW